MAILLGASSPKTSEKYDVMSVMTTTEKPLITPAGIPLRKDIFPIAPESILTNVCDADAEVKKPARVTPIWIVERKPLESAVSFKTCFAFLLPSSAIFAIFVSLREIIAISLMAKKALRRISTNSKII